MGARYRGVATKNFGTTSLKLSRLQGNALHYKVPNVFGQISRTIFLKCGSPDPPPFPLGYASGYV